MVKLLARIGGVLSSPKRLAHSVQWRAWRCGEVLLAGGARLLHRPATPLSQIVICGYPRSGTSLLYNMFSASLPGFRFDEFERTALDSIWKRENHASKRPLDIQRVEKILRWNIHRKHLFIVVPVRDVRDIITSVHPVASSGYYIGFDSSLTRPSDASDQAGTREIGVRHVLSAIERARSVAAEQLVFVRYEDLVEDPDRVQKQLANRLGIRFSASFSRFHESPEKHAYRYDRASTLQEAARESSAPDRSRIGKWRADRHRERIHQQFTRHPELFEVLRRDGYEPDDSWFEAYRTASPASPADIP